MPARSYSYFDYLVFLKSNGKSALFGKILLILVAQAVFFLGIYSAFFYTKLKKETSMTAQKSYLEQVTGSFNSSKQSLDEVLKLLSVAGAKTEIVDNLKESATPSAGFLVSLDDLQKILSRIAIAQKNIKFQQDILADIETPLGFLQLHKQLADYYNQSSRLLAEMQQNYSFSKEFLLALGPNFYLPVISNEKLWENGDKQRLIDYYQDLKKEADFILLSLSRLSVPEGFREYFNTQLEYLNLAVSVSDSIINTLSVSDDQTSKETSQIEKAYQLLTIAQGKNENLSQKLLVEKLKLFNLKENLEKFASVKLIQNALEEDLVNAASSQSEIKDEPGPLSPGGLYLQVLKKFGF